MEKNPYLEKKVQKFFAPKVKSMENTNKFSKNEKLIEKKFILTQELKLGSMKCPTILILRKMIFL